MGRVRDRDWVRTAFWDTNVDSDPFFSKQNHSKMMIVLNPIRTRDLLSFWFKMVLFYETFKQC